MATEGPRKMGVYEGTGPQRAQSKTVLGVAAAIILLLILFVLIV
jgi:hypothetical protein